MRVLWFLIAFIVAVNSFSVARAATPCPSPSAANVLPAPSLEQKIWIATRIYDTVKQYFAHWEALPSDYDFDTEYRAFVEQAVNAKTRVVFDLSIMKLFGSLANGHTDFLDKELVCQDTLPFRAQVMWNSWVVTRSHHPELSPGDVITAIDDQPFGKWVEQRLPYVRGSNFVASENHLFTFGLIWPVHFKLTLSNGKMVTINRDAIYPNASRGLPMLPSTTQTSVHENGIVRIAIPSFNKPEYENAAIDAINAHTEAPAVLFDLRGNGGGTTPMALVYTVLEHPVRDMLSVTPLHIGSVEASIQGSDGNLPNAMVRTGGELIQPNHPVYHGPVFVLTDRHCVSACEDFVNIMRISHRAMIMGETTEGSTGQPRSVDFPNSNMSFRVSTRREYFPDASPFEGVGIKPDISILLTHAMLVSKDDAVLKYAMTIIRKYNHR